MSAHFLKQLAHQLKQTRIAPRDRSLTHAYLLSREPFIAVAKLPEFFRHFERLKLSLPQNQDTTLLLQLGYTSELQQLVAHFEEFQKQLKFSHPFLETLILTNSRNEAEQLESQGLEARYCHQSAFLDERKYRIWPDIEKKYDAICKVEKPTESTANILQGVHNLKLLTPSTKRPFVFYLRGGSLPNKTLISSPSLKEQRQINEAMVGLCFWRLAEQPILSIEYLLCGVPIVTTEKFASREVLLPKFAYRTSELEPFALNAAVNELKRLSPEPQKIRASTVFLMNQHRRMLIEIIQEIFDRKGVQADYSAEWDQAFTHKLGLH